MPDNLYPEKLQILVELFVQKMHLLNKADNPQLVAKISIKWTDAQPLLTKKLLQYTLATKQKIIEGEEAIAVEKIIRNRLLKEFKQDELTLEIRKLLYQKDLDNLIETTGGELNSADRLYLARIQTSLGLKDQDCQQINRAKQLLQLNTAQISRNEIIFDPQPSTWGDIQGLPATSALAQLERQQLENLARIGDRDLVKANAPYSPGNKRRWLWWCLPLLLLFIPTSHWLRNYQTARNIELQSQQVCIDLSSRESPRMSLGEKLLTKQYGQLHPTSVMAFYEGMAAFARCEFAQAHQKFSASLAIDKNNPEILIYQNNAQAISKKHFKLAVSVPLGTKPEIAWEILRGVAQAQAEINQQGGIREGLLLIQIVNDDNNPQVARQVARQLAQDEAILATIGHNDSNSSLAAAQIYEEEKLVMISPTSTSTKLSGVGEHIMRTIPSVSALADKLASYAAVNSLQKIGICADIEDAASSSFRQEFSQKTLDRGGVIEEISCNLAQTDLQPEAVVENALNQNVDAILLAPSVNRMNQAIAIAQANQQQLPLLGNHSLYTEETIKSGQEAIVGMVIPSPWLADDTTNNFAQKARQYWGGNVNWRTAMAYDAVEALAQGLQQANNPHELQSALTQTDFLVNGVTGKFHFEQGDRLGDIQLAYIKKMPSNPPQYQFSRLSL